MKCGECLMARVEMVELGPDGVCPVCGIDYGLRRSEKPATEVSESEGTSLPSEGETSVQGSTERQAAYWDIRRRLGEVAWEIEGSVGLDRRRLASWVRSCLNDLCDVFPELHP